MSRTYDKVGRRSRAPRRFGAVAPTMLAALFVALLTTGGVAHAQTDIDVQQFRPNPHTLGGFTVDSARVLPHLKWSVGLFLNVANDPLNLTEVSSNDRVWRFVEEQWTADLLFSIGLFDIVDIGVDLPLHVDMSGRGVGPDPAAAGLAPNGIGDLRITPRVQVLDGLFGLGFALDLQLGTGNDESFMSHGGIRVAPRVNMHLDFDVALLLFNAGVRLQDDRRLADLEVEHELFLSFAGIVPIEIADAHELAPIVEIQTFTGLASPFGSENESGVELRGGLRYRAPFGMAVSAGAGTGLAPGYGTPDYRVFVGVQWDPELKGECCMEQCPDPDPDCDRICSPWVTAKYGKDYGTMDIPKCAKKGTCKETLDGVAEDQCPEVCDRFDQCPHQPEDFDGFQDDDGCPDPDNDGDRICDPWVAEKGMEAVYAHICKHQNDQCPNVPEDFDGYEDRDGCPDVDNDGDRICDPWVSNDWLQKHLKLEAATGKRKFARARPPIVCPEHVLHPEAKCPNEKNGAEFICRLHADGESLLHDVCPDRPEKYNGNEDDDGCPDCRKTIQFEKQIQFTRARHYIKDMASYDELDYVARRLATDLAHVKKIRVEGHTSDRWGGAGEAWEGRQQNIDLSCKRAREVYMYLTDQRPKTGRPSDDNPFPLRRVSHPVDPERLEFAGFGWTRFDDGTAIWVDPKTGERRTDAPFIMTEKSGDGDFEFTVVGKRIDEGERPDVFAWREACRRTVFSILDAGEEEGCESPCSVCRDVLRAGDDEVLQPVKKKAVRRRGFGCRGR